MNDSDQHEAQPVEPREPELPAVDRTSPELASAPPEGSAIGSPGVVVLSGAIHEPIAASPDASTRSMLSGADVHVVSNVLEIATGTASAAQAAVRAETHDLDAVVHRLLVVGLAISTVLMLIGLALDLLLRREIPTVVPDLGEVWTRVLAIRPSGFLALGLLVLIATPIVRVVGSIIIFAYERDWRFALITLVVLAIVTLSLLLGRS